MHLTKDALLNDTKKVNDLVTLTLTFVATGGIVLHKHMYFCPVCLLSTLIFAITFATKKIEASYLACILN